MSVGMGASTKEAIIASARTRPMTRLVNVLMFSPPKKLWLGTGFLVASFPNYIYYQNPLLKSSLCQFFRHYIFHKEMHSFLVEIHIRHAILHKLVFLFLGTQTEDFVCFIGAFVYS
jgi:hypothetical protein